MIQFLNQVDTSLFLWLNSFHNTHWDLIMTWVSGKKSGYLYTWHYWVG
ncbi:MAG: hypothetical protein HC896_04675 [Bacteroidales bacterium]|nr:hypothetical protein [Bacteroidales bacterium]